MEIKDLVGLSKPLTKLIETISQGVGAVSTPFLIRRTADAKAYEIRTISCAIAESRKLLTTTTYNAGEVAVLPAESSPATPLPDRVRQRLDYQEATQQINLEAITQQAADEMASTPDVSDDAVDPDWIARFFGMAQEITTDEMQRLWGRILAGEVKRPGSYSLRTLDILRNVSRGDADLFCKAAALCLRSGDKAFVVNADRYKFLETVFGLSFTDFLVLKDLGLIFETELAFQFTPQKAGSSSDFLYAGHIVMLERTADTPELKLPALVFTKAGMELLDLVSPTFDMAYAQKVCSLLRRDGIEFNYARVLRDDKGTIHYEGLQKLPLEQ